MFKELGNKFQKGFISNSKYKMQEKDIKNELFVKFSKITYLRAFIEIL